MMLNELSAISPIDGRYRKQTESLSGYFSEFALIRYRVFVEIEYFIALCKLPLPELRNFDQDKIAALRKIHQNFSIEDATEIKQIEAKTNHDVKAVEYFIKSRFDQLELTPFREFVHFGLTSQDINNTAIPGSVKDFLDADFSDIFTKLITRLSELSITWKDVPMLARTHGQPASPTRLGKEINVFAERLRQQYTMMLQIPISAKFGGATGNFNAHVAAYPDIDWNLFATHFVEKDLGLSRTKFTTQIEPYDNFAALCDAVKRINNILIDLDRDIWMYISMGYFAQKIISGEVGSSAMPHKVNPIDFENSEGNLGIANALFEHFSAKLPISRLQRDLTDSTVLRNIGVPFSHTIIAIKSLLKGLNKITLNEEVLNADLENNWVVVSEAIQTILRKEGFPDPYEKLKSFTRGNKPPGKEEMTAFINQLDIPDELRKKLLAITPFNYTGIY